MARITATFTAFAFVLAAAACVSCDDKDAKSDRVDIKGSKSNGDGADDKPKAPEVPTGKVFFVSPKDGATVPTKFKVEMGVEGKTVKPAGATERDPLFGHHHILIDGSPIADLTVVPKNEKHLHYGDGSTDTILLLTPGAHTLTLQFADGSHRSYGPDWATTIKVTVSEGPAAADGKAAPADGKAAPADGKAAPTDGKAAPADGKVAPTDGKAAPADG
ncbi:MAG: DUF4399 domain-containing protein [Nannocystaceae bacterium]|nr:DUF4399 domain-containing protein [Nannocystaceae bacterium]